MSRTSSLPDGQPPAAAPDEAPSRAIALEDHLPAARERTAPAEDALGGAGLRVATPMRRERRDALLAIRGTDGEVRVAIAPEVDLEVIDDAIERGDGVLVEVVPGAAPLVIGVLSRRRPPQQTIRAAQITIEADDELLLRAGRAALRLRGDGDVELVGSRISATSRGLFRLVGRLLRLN